MASTSHCNKCGTALEQGYCPSCDWHEKPIDYERMKKVYPKQKAALTRAKKMVDANLRYLAVLKLCQKAVQEWDLIGAWPDGWATWQSALDDATWAAQRTAGTRVSHKRLEDLYP